MVRLEMKTTDQLVAWLPQQQEEYIAERMKAGESSEVAHRISDSQFAELFPNGSPADGQYVMNVVDDTDVVVSLVIAIPVAETLIALVAWYYFRKGKWKTIPV